MPSHRIAWDDGRGVTPSSSQHEATPSSPTRRRTVDGGGCDGQGFTDVRCDPELMADEMLRKTAEQAALLSPFRRILRVLDIRILTKTSIQLQEAEEIRALLYDCALGGLDLHKPVFLYQQHDAKRESDADTIDADATGDNSWPDGSGSPRCSTYNNSYNNSGSYASGYSNYGRGAGYGGGAAYGDGGVLSPVLDAYGVGGGGGGTRPSTITSSSARFELLADEEMQRWLRSM